MTPPRVYFVNIYALSLGLNVADDLLVMLMEVISWGSIGFSIFRTTG